MAPISKYSILQVAPPYLGKKTVHFPFGKGNNTYLIKTILSDYPAAKAQAKTFAQKFIGPTLVASGKNVWDFLKHQITYKEDSRFLQAVKSPVALMAEGTGDCKSYSLFAAAVMANLGYRVEFVFASYDKTDPTPTHVYIYAYDRFGNKIIIDGVWHSFNKEKAAAHKNKFDMEIISITGIGAQGKGRAKVKAAVKKGKTAVKNTVKATVKTAKKAIDKAGPVAKKAGMLAPRNAFLLLVQINFHSYATKLHKMRGTSLRLWQKLGGNTASLSKAIDSGLKRKAIFGLLETQAETGSLPIGVAETTAAALAAAVPVIVAFNAILKESKNTLDNAKNLLNDKESKAANEIINDTADTYAGGTPANNVPDNNAGADVNNSGNTTTNPKSSGTINPLLLAAAALGAFLILK